MIKYVLAIAVGLTITSCKKSSVTQNIAKKETLIEVPAASTSKDSSIVYKTKTLIIQKLSNHVYSHTSFLNTDTFGKVPCNGMLVINKNEAIVFDTPADNSSSKELIDYVNKKLHSTIKALVPTHFHEDCIGGLEIFNKNKISSYASNKTIELLKNKKRKNIDIIKSFNDSLILNVGDKKLYAIYFGEGHTKDNIIGYFPEDKAIFGGCLIKELNANKGNLEDANTKEWSKTVQKIKLKYPQIEIVIPGHGKCGGAELFDYTIQLFK